MSTWNLGLGDVSEETRSFRDKLASKDGQIAAQQDRITKQTAEYTDLQERFNEAMHKLATETQRALQLEAQLRQRTEDLRNEQIASENSKSALNACVEKNKAAALELRQMETNLERISHTSDEHYARSLKLEKEKATVELRVKELESIVNQRSNLTPAPSRNVPMRSRSSSLSNFKISTLEQELNDTRSLLEQKNHELERTTRKLSKLEEDLLKGDNDRAAANKKWISEIGTLKSTIRDMDEELIYLREQQGDGSREEELLKRIEEDDAKISALESMLGDASDIEALQNQISRLESQLRKEEERAALAEQLRAELLQERDDALTELHDSRHELQQLLRDHHEREARELSLRERAAKTSENCDEVAIDDMDTTEPQVRSSSPSRERLEVDGGTVAHVERLLSAIERLRGERDSLRRDVQFLESESRFAIEALEAKLSASMSTASNSATIATIDQLRAEMDDMHAQMLAVGEQYETKTRQKNTAIRRLGLQVEGLSVALCHLDGLVDAARSQKSRSSISFYPNPPSTDHETTQLTLMRLNMEALANERDQLLQELGAKETLWEQQVDAARMDDHEVRGDLEAAEYEIETLNAFLQEVESERDSLALQLTNLTSDLQTVQQELSEAETRYTNLQFHQLNAMTSNEATRTLRQHIEELEGRIMRRNEQIGVHQHDIRRLEANLQLQEDRLIEMSNEQELIMAQKEAMVEDCADARDQRDAALANAENLEEQLEIVEMQNNDNAALVVTLIAVIADTVSSARRKIRTTEDQATELRSWSLNSQSCLKRELDEKVDDLRKLARQFQEQQTELESTRAALIQQQLDLADATAELQNLHAEKSRLETDIEVLQIYNKDVKDKDPLHDHLNEDTDQAAGAMSDGSSEHSSVHPEPEKYTNTLASLQERLSETESALAELRNRHNACVGDHQRAAQEAESIIQELRQQINTNDINLSQLRDLHDQLADKELVHRQGIAELKERLKQAEQAHDNVLEKYQTLECEVQRSHEELERLKREHDSILDGSREEFQTIQRDLEKKVSTIQGRFEEEARLLDISKEEVSRLTSRLAEETAMRTDTQKVHTSALALAVERAEAAEQNAHELQKQLATLQGDLKAAQAELASCEYEKTCLQQDTTSHEAEIQKSKSLIRYLEVQIKESEQSIMALREDVERLQSDIARSEKTCKAAEVNLSLQNAQHKRETAEFQRELAALRVRPNVEQALLDLEERNNEMEELLRAKCAEIEENDDRVLEMLKEKKKLSTKVESLNRKVQNLQAKLAAAKASPNLPMNPSNSPEMRNGDKSPPESTSSHRISSRSSPSFALAAQTFQDAAASSLSQSVTAPVVPLPASSSSVPPPSLKRKSCERTTSAPSQIARSTTPERHRLSNPSFKIRTPDPRFASEGDMATTIVIGKKRAAPDDFEVCESVPAQAFTAEGEDVENKTPRVRRVLNTLQSGFTPLRHQNNRPTAPSAQRTAPVRTAPYISDLTNNPDVVSVDPDSAANKSNKRGWLGKIRGSSRPTERQPSSRSLFERGESS